MEVMQMAECRCRAQCRGSARSSARSERAMESLENMPMNRYINPNIILTREPESAAGGSGGGGQRPDGGAAGQAVREDGRH